MHAGQATKFHSIRQGACYCSTQPLVLACLQTGMPSLTTSSPSASCPAAATEVRCIETCRLRSFSPGLPARAPTLQPRQALLGACGKLRPPLGCLSLTWHCHASAGLIIPVMDRVLGPYLRGGGAKAFNFQALSTDLLVRSRGSSCCCIVALGTPPGRLRGPARAPLWGVLHPIIRFQTFVLLAQSPCSRPLWRSPSACLPTCRCWPAPWPRWKVG